MKSLDRKLLDYLPPFLQEYNELKILTQTEQPEIEAAWKAADNLLQQPFVLSATEYGIGRIEKIIGIHPYDTDDLETRKFRVLMKLRETLPYTYRTVNRYLGTMCEGIPYQFQIDVKHYLVTAVFELGEIQKLRELYRYLDRVIPCNLMIDFTAKQVFKFYQEIDYRSRMKFKNAVYPRANIPYLYYDGTISFEEGYYFHGYKITKNIVFFPTRLTIKTNSRSLVVDRMALRLRDSYRQQTSIKQLWKLISRRELLLKKETRLTIPSQIKRLPDYQTTVTIYYHITNYNSQYSYDGTRRYDSKIIKEII